MGLISGCAGRSRYCGVVARGWWLMGPVPLHARWGGAFLWPRVKSQVVVFLLGGAPTAFLWYLCHSHINAPHHHRSHRFFSFIKFFNVIIFFDTHVKKIRSPSHNCRCPCIYLMSCGERNIHNSTWKKWEKCWVLHIVSIYVFKERLVARNKAHISTLLTNSTRCP